MSGGEVATVLHAHMRNLEINDPYREDFYYYNYMLKEKRREQEEMNSTVLGAKCLDRSDSISSSNTNTSEASIPLPVWQETKEKAMAKKDDLWNKFAENTKGWEEKNKVFGHVQKSNPHRPRALLNLSTPENKDDEKNKKEKQNDDEEDEEIFMTTTPNTVAPFSDKVWGARKSIENAKIALLAIDEQRRLLSRPDIDEIQRNKTNIALSENFNLLQEALSFSSSSSNKLLNSDDTSLLENITEQDKGKKLLIRVFKLLPSQAIIILPISLKNIYSILPLNKHDILKKYSDDSNQINLKLLYLNKIECEELFLKSCFKVINAAPIVNPTTMVSKSLITFNTVKTCMENIMKPHIVGKTLGLALHSKQRVELVQAIMKKGEEIIEDESEANKIYWKTLTKAFYDLASKSPTN
mmetsp:Transcript_26714/g.34705  ORF Transcript_26714/g.34705 Transcript_26714/m.34705 type:complete len:411 (+) Transcript_26714:1008-2240(+)